MNDKKAEKLFIHILFTKSLPVDTNSNPFCEILFILHIRFIQPNFACISTLLDVKTPTNDAFE